MEDLLLIWVLILGFIYSIPSIIAFSKGHPNRYLIMILNIALGATLVGWLIALVWAMNLINKPR